MLKFKKDYTVKLFDKKDGVEKDYIFKKDSEYKYIQILNTYYIEGDKVVGLNKYEIEEYTDLFDKKES